MLTILPAIYEDIQDNIFLAIGGDQTIWNNFYHLTLSKAQVKSDLFRNIQFYFNLLFI